MNGWIGAYMDAWMIIIVKQNCNEESKKGGVKKIPRPIYNSWFCIQPIGHNVV